MSSLNTVKKKKKKVNKLPGTDSAKYLQEMPKQRDVNSPEDFSEITDMLKTTPVIKCLAALESSRGIVRALLGLLKP